MVKANSAVALHNLTQLLIIHVSVYHQCAQNDRVLDPVVAFPGFCLSSTRAESATQFSPGQSETAPRVYVVYNQSRL